MVPISRALACAFALTCVPLACTVYKRPEIVDVPKPGAGQSVTISSPVRAHLLSGETIQFEAGAIAEGGWIRSPSIGSATRYSLTLKNLGFVNDPISLDSVFAIESVRDRVDGSATLVLTLLGVGVVAVPTVAIISCLNNPKCFGSCPTIYSDSAGTPVLEAEGFSYSIAPIFEAPDLDRLRARPDSDGSLRLEVRDEAYETHYINQAGLVEVTHDSDELALPDAKNHPLAVADLASPVTARDRQGRDVLPELSRQDGHAYATAPERLSAATPQDYRDFIDLTFTAPPGRDSAALVFRMRNSLLNTVLLYELMLGDPGLRSLDWMGRELNQIGPATRLGAWYVDHMGMRVSVWDGSAYREVARVADTGPVAWKDVAVRVPVLTRDTVRVRLDFVADDWRIDQVRLAARVRVPVSRAIPAVVLERADGHSDSAALGNLREVDTRYLVTTPGQRFFLTFETGRAAPGVSRTFLFASQGYYIEWLRGDWLRTEHLAATFEPTDDALIKALKRWQAEHADLERRFAATRVPVR